MDDSGYIFLIFLAGMICGTTGGAAFIIHIIRDLKAFLRQVQGCLVVISLGCLGIGVVAGVNLLI